MKKAKVRNAICVDTARSVNQERERVKKKKEKQITVHHIAHDIFHRLLDINYFMVVVRPTVSVCVIIGNNIFVGSV
jgi:hypothetical protein